MSNCEDSDASMALGFWRMEMLYGGPTAVCLT